MFSFFLDLFKFGTNTNPENGQGRGSAGEISFEAFRGLFAGDEPGSPTGAPGFGEGQTLVGPLGEGKKHKCFCMFLLDLSIFF